MDLIASEGAISREEGAEGGSFRSETAMELTEPVVNMSVNEDSQGRDGNAQTVLSRKKLLQDLERPVKTRAAPQCRNIGRRSRA